MPASAFQRLSSLPRRWLDGVTAGYRLLQGEEQKSPRHIFSGGRIPLQRANIRPVPLHLEPCQRFFSAQQLDVDIDNRARPTANGPEHGPLQHITSREQVGTPRINE